MKKGFTLIELLAVIIILAVIAVIATPIVLNVIDSAKLKAFEESAYGIIETVKLRNYEGMFEGTDTNKTYTFPNDELVFQGEKPKGGSVASQNGEVVLAIHNGKWCATKKLSEEKITITEDIENCDLKLVSLSGNITGIDTFKGNETYDQIIPIEGKVQLIKNNKIAYETDSDSAGNYEFENIIADDYLLLVSQPYKTKHAFQLTLNEDTTKDMEVALEYGDLNDDNVINSLDIIPLSKCYNANITVRLECGICDFNGDTHVNAVDLTFLNARFGHISKIEMDDETHGISGKITADVEHSFYDDGLGSIEIYDSSKNIYEVYINEDETYSIDNLPSGTYMIVLRNGDSYLTQYEKVVILDDDITVDIHEYYGDFDNNYYLDENDLKQLEKGITSFQKNGLTTSNEKYDLNGDDVIDEIDIEILRERIEKDQNDRKTNLGF